METWDILGPRSFISPFFQQPSPIPPIPSPETTCFGQFVQVLGGLRHTEVDVQVGFGFVTPQGPHDLRENRPKDLRPGGGGKGEKIASALGKMIKMIEFYGNC